MFFTRMLPFNNFQQWVVLRFLFLNALCKFSSGSTDGFDFKVSTLFVINIEKIIKLKGTR